MTLLLRFLMPWFWVTIPTSLWLIAADVSLLRRGPRVGGRLSFRLRVGFSFALRFSHARTGGWRGLARLVPMVQAQARPGQTTQAQWKPLLDTQHWPKRVMRRSPKSETRAPLALLRRTAALQAATCGRDYSSRWGWKTERAFQPGRVTI